MEKSVIIGHAKTKLQKVIHYGILMGRNPGGLRDAAAAERLGIPARHIYLYRTGDIPGIVPKRNRHGSVVIGVYIWVPNDDWRQFAEDILVCAARTPEQFSRESREPRAQDILLKGEGIESDSKFRKLVAYVRLLARVQNGLTDIEAANILRELYPTINITDVFRYRKGDVSGIVEKRNRNGEPVKGKYIWIPTREWQALAEAILRLSPR